MSQVSGMDTMDNCVPVRCMDLTCTIYEVLE